jgi:hypothetical protein
MSRSVARDAIAKAAASCAGELKDLLKGLTIALSRPDASEIVSRVRSTLFRELVKRSDEDTREQAAVVFFQIVADALPKRDTNVVPFEKRKS